MLPESENLQCSDRTPDTAYSPVEYDVVLGRVLTKELILRPLEIHGKSISLKRRLFETLGLVESNPSKFDLFSDIEEHSKEEATEIMTKTIEQYMSKTRGYYGSGVTRPKINGDTYFELKGQFLKELHDNTFSVSEIKKVNKKVYAAQVGCELCKGLHYNKDFPLKEEGKALEESYYTQFGFSDLGACVSVMPLSTYTNLGLRNLAYTRLTVELADRTIKHPKGIAENMLVKIGKFIFPTDFVILDMPEDDDVPLILGRPFLSTAHAKIDGNLWEQSASEMTTLQQSYDMEIMFRETSQYVTYTMLRALDITFSLLDNFAIHDKYMPEILKKFGFTDVKKASTLIETQKHLLKDKDGENMCACARYQVNLKVSHLHAVKRIFRYLKGQPKLGLWYPKDSPFDLDTLIVIMLEQAWIGSLQQELLQVVVAKCFGFKIWLLISGDAKNGNVVNENVQENVGNVLVNGNRVGCSHKEILAYNPKECDGKGGVVVLTRWIEKMENVQDMSGCSVNQKVKYTAGSFVVAPPPTSLFSPLTIDLSSSGLEEFQQPEFKGYGLRANKSVCDYSSNETKKNSDAPLIEE
ncbi:retrovirus-related pol polyprotein from transposon TNT 1-94 [Tanacetum coccineum]